jgi:outer membrane receptor protein involved in Fe transport
MTRCLPPVVPPASIPAPRLALSLLAAAMGSALAQGAPGNPGDTTQTIVVTAQKREQSAQSVPVSLTAISGKSLEAAGIASAADLDQVAAGLTIGSVNPGYLSITIRGISDLGGGLLGGPSTGFYIDETPLSAFTSQLPQVAFWDAERVEVLRGPQGTLFGEGSMGGTVRLITAKPDARAFTARAMVGWSKVAEGGSGGSVRAMVNVPLVARQLALRVSASHQDIIGWIDVPDLGRKDANNGKQDDARVALRWTPSKALTVDLSFAHQQLDTRDFSATSVGVFRPKDYNPGALPVNFIGQRKSQYDIGNVTVSYDLGPASLVTALSRYQRKTVTRTDYTPYIPLFFGAGVVGTAENGVDPLTVKATTAEVRLVSNGDQTFNWTAGAYAKDDKRVQANSGLKISIPAFGLPDDQALNTTPAQNKATALFGDAEVKLTSSIALQAGLRHYRASNETRIQFTTTSAIFPGNTAGVVQPSSGSASATSPKLGLSWKLKPDLLLFAKFSSGFRDGDSNFQAPNEPLIPAAYKPEKIRAYELGVKSQPLPWLTVNGSVYLNDWTDLQLRFSTPDGLWSYIQNAGKAKSTGAEIEFAARPMAGLRLGLNLAAVDSKISQDVVNTVNGPGGTTVSRNVATAGSRIPFSPRLQASVSAGYEFALTGELGGVVSANCSHRGETYSDPANTENLKNSAFNNLYLKAGVNGHTWGAAVFVSNATNSTASQQKTSAPGGGIPLINYVQPRTLGVELNASF